MENQTKPNQTKLIATPLIKQKNTPNFQNSQTQEQLEITTNKNKTNWSKTMNLDLVLPDKASLNEEVGDVLTLVALELDDLAKLLVLHHGSVAAELLLEVLEDLLVAELLLQPLHCGQTLLPIPLLNSNMHILLCSGGIRFSRLGKRVEWGGDLDFQINHVLCLLET